jgi:hypothetical protein
VAVGKEGEVAPFVAWDDPEPFGIGYYGICTGWGASGSWLIEGECVVEVETVKYGNVVLNITGFTCSYACAVL